MGTIFILAGSMLGFIAAVFLVGFGNLPLLAGLAIWIASGPVAALMFTAIIMPLSRAVRHAGPIRHLA
ncbi:hypothetical protein [Limimaricola hongkongensis]|uniref:Uncharacterized protein n=1 Tax=Limimaricola hongkongensis DSM 17492 TaxID=1122180 RepID=A0A017HES6_9RHOB|nr:hypothetical protein [Limimaricola hongkongensis]EYD72633.1 hypothetical protein Lokhon_01434 [Limimaricola hongkongensis DSM 17492]